MELVTPRPTRCSLQGPVVGDRPSYDQVSGWRLVEVGALGEALEAAQACGHGRLALVEVDRKVQREEAVCLLGYVCRQCGQQTLLPSSPYCRAAPPGYQANKEFSAALGRRAFSRLVELVQADATIRRIEVPQGGRSLLTKFTEQPEELLLEGAAIKQEVVEEDMENSYLEPTVCLTEPEEVSSGLASVDPATVTTNTPALALATVMPDTPVLGGRVTPHPLHQLIPVHPSLFIR